MNKVDFDIIIIGSGMGGLVCGCYLAKAGKKVLIVEKNSQPGGYCTSFKRGNFIIDAAVHCVQNVEKDNILHKVIQELGIDNDIIFKRANPTDTIITKNHKININNSIEETIENFLLAFPAESEKIKNFFGLICSNDFVCIYSKYKNESFKDVLDNFFKNDELKDIFSIFLGNIGSLPFNTSAVVAFALLKQFILFGGYYPLGGIQKIPDSFATKFRENGGCLLLKNKVNKIILHNHQVYGIELSTGELIRSKVVISNSDLTYTFKELLNLQSDDNSRDFFNRLLSYKPSYSIFILYILLNKRLRDSLDAGPGIWQILDRQTIESDMSIGQENIMLHNGIFLSISSKLDDSLMPDGTDVVRMITNTEYHGSFFWEKNKDIFSEKLFVQGRKIIPELDNSLICKKAIHSETLKNYTLNRDGAVCGWMNSNCQVNNPIKRYLPVIQNLFFVGHWITDRYGNGGVAMVADSGRKVAKTILGSFN